MKKWKNLIVLEGFREVKQGKSQFYSLFAIAVLWVLIFVGLTVSLTEVERGFSDIYESLNGYDLQITSDLPLSEDDVSALDEHGYNVIGNYEFDTEIILLDQIYVTRAVGLPRDPSVNAFHLMEGGMPSSTEECVVSPEFFLETGLNIGDFVTLSVPEENHSFLKESSSEILMIVGVGQSAEYLSNQHSLTKLGNGLLTSQIYLHEDCFSGDYSKISLKLGENQDSITVQESLAELSQHQWKENSDSYLKIAQDQLNIANSELEQAENLVEQAKNSLDSELIALETEISLSWATYNPDETQDLERITALEAEYSEKISGYQFVQEDLEETLTIYRKNQEQAQRDYQVLQESRWEISEKEDNLAYKEFQKDLASWGNFAHTVPTIFFWIFAVISLFMMSRMMSEQRTLIGGLLGLGYKKREIVMKYIAFSGLCGISSALFANGLALTIIPYFIHSHWGKTYLLDQFQFSFHPEITLLTLVLSVILLVFVTIIPFYLLTRGEPVNLMRPKAPTPGKHIFLEKNYILWNELNFNQKVAVRTLFRHKSRLFSSIIAIAVTTALIITALALQNTYPLGAVAQFDEIYLYTTEITAKNHAVSQELLEVEGVLSEYGLHDSYATAYCQEVSMDFQGSTLHGDFYVFDSRESAEKVINFRLGRLRSYYMPETGVILPIKLADTLGVNMGDTIDIPTQSGTATMMVTALSEQYHEHRIYMTEDYYHWLTGETIQENKLLLQLPSEIRNNPEELAEFEEKILSLDGVASLVHLDTLSDDYTTSNNLLKNAMLAFFVASCILAYLVLNQLNYNSLLYRRRELATLKVMGLYDRELSAYVYRENIIYTFLGLVLGVVFGQNIYLWFVKSIETENMMLYRSVSFHDYIYGVGLTVIFALIVNILSHYKIKKMNMMENLKQTE